MYGDHLPTMGLTVEDVDNKYLFQTQYVMWDNFGLEKKDVNLAAYQMAAEVLDRVGIREGTVFRYHQARRNTKNSQVDLETLQYDLLYGEQHSYEGENPFKRTKMRLGLYDVTLDGVSPGISLGSYLPDHGNRFYAVQSGKTEWRMARYHLCKSHDTDDLRYRTGRFRQAFRGSEKQQLNTKGSEQEL